MMKFILWPLAFIGAYIVFEIVRGAWDARKDPDVIAANAIGMSVIKYRKFLELESGLHRAFEQGGTDAHFAHFNKHVFPIIKDNPNQWERFVQYRRSQQV